MCSVQFYCYNDIDYKFKTTRPSLSSVRLRFIPSASSQLAALRCFVEFNVGRVIFHFPVTDGDGVV